MSESPHPNLILTLTVCLELYVITKKLCSPRFLGKIVPLRKSSARLSSSLPWHGFCKSRTPQYLIQERLGMPRSHCETNEYWKIYREEQARTLAFRLRQLPVLRTAAAFRLVEGSSAGVPGSSLQTHYSCGFVCTESFIRVDFGILNFLFKLCTRSPGLEGCRNRPRSIDNSHKIFGNWMSRHCRARV